MTLNLNLTKSAAKQIKQLGDFEKAPYFRVSVDGGGCSGFQYKFDFDTEKRNNDIEISAFGVKILVDDISQGFLHDAELDYVEELLGSFFKVNNPNATASDSRDGRGSVYYLASGPSLYLADGELQPLI